MGFGKSGPECPCRGPAAWSALLPSLHPLAPTASIDSLIVSATNQPEVVKSNSKRDWFRLPNWAFPVRPVRLPPDDDDPSVPLDTILAGRTKSPIRVVDLRAFLRGDEHVSVASSQALEFLLTYNSYRAAFFALPLEKQAPHPAVAISGLSLANKAAEIQSRFSTSSRSSSGPVPPQAAKTHAVNPFRAHPRLDPEFQPLRQEQQNIIDLYLQPHSLSPITSLVPPNTLIQALSSAKLTTHPSALDPIASRIHSHLTTETLPRFLDHAVANLSVSTSRGRLLIACIAFAAAIVLEVFMIMYHTGRPARLFALPLWMLAIGYAIGSRTGLCFWLALRGTREHKSYERVLPSFLPNDSGFRFSAANLTPGPQPPRLLLACFNIFAQRQTGAGILDRPHTMAEKGQLPPNISLSIVVNEQQTSHDLRKSFSEDYQLSPVGSINSSTPLVESKDGLVKKLMRLTGTAVDTVAVEDSRVRKLQAMVGVRVAAWLFLGTSMVVAIVMAIP